MPAAPVASTPRDDEGIAVATRARPVVRALRAPRARPMDSPPAAANPSGAARSSDATPSGAPSTGAALARPTPTGDIASSPPPATAPQDASPIDLAALLHELQPALTEPRLRPSALSIASVLAFRLGVERVSIGVGRPGAVSLVAVSDAPDVAPRGPLARALEAAMAETASQDLPLLHGVGGAGGLLAHRALAAAGGARCVYSLPLRHDGVPCGVLLCERLRVENTGNTPGETIAPACRHACEALAGVLGPALELKRRDAAGGWVRRMRGRIAAFAAALAATAALALVDADYRVSAPARVEGSVQRVLVAPFDGYVETAHARAGDRVSAGEVLATLQQSTLVLERDARASEGDDLEKQYHRARAARDWAEAGVLEARMAQARAAVDLLDARIERTRIAAPFDGVVLSGDLGRSLGAPVERGQTLFELAPLDGQRVVLQVDERDVGAIAPGMRGSLGLAALPDAAIPLTVERVSGAARSEAGGPVFLVEARLDGAAEALRPGMEGTAKVSVEPRPLLWIVTHRLVEWVQLTLWRLLP